VIAIVVHLLLIELLNYKLAFLRTKEDALHNTSATLEGKKSEATLKNLQKIEFHYQFHNGADRVRVAAAPQTTDPKQVKYG